jgi:hypothetical protein
VSQRIAAGFWPRKAPREAPADTCRRVLNGLRRLPMVRPERRGRRCRLRPSLRI